MKLIFAAAVALTPAFLPAQITGVYDVLDRYGIVTFADYNPRGESEGPVLVGGNVNAGNSFQVGANYGDQVGETAINRSILTVKGTIQGNGNWINVQNGFDVIAGSTQNTHFNYNAGHAGLGSSSNRAGQLVLNAGGYDQVVSTMQLGGATLRDSAKNTSLQLMAQEANGIVRQPSQTPGALVFDASGTTSSVVVFNIAGSVFSSGNYQQYEIVGLGERMAVFNVSGTAVNWNNGANFVGSMASTELADQLLWNLYQAQTIDFGGNWRGSILAPLAAVNLGNSNLDGSIIANSVTHAGEVHFYGLQNPNTLKAIPEPGLAGLVAPLLLALARRRRAPGLPHPQSSR